MMAIKMLSSKQTLGVVAQRNTINVCAAMSTSMQTPAQPNKKVKESLRSKIGSIFGFSIQGRKDDEYIPQNQMHLPHSVDAATGEGKLILLAFENGIIDPYCQFPMQVPKGLGTTKENAIKVESFGDERIIGCRCEETQTFNKYMTLFKGEPPKRCLCGFWMELVDAPKFWEKIPKEDLLEIPFFMELEQEGKLDKFLAGELDHEMDGHHEQKPVHT